MPPIATPNPAPPEAEDAAPMSDHAAIRSAFEHMAAQQWADAIASLSATAEAAPDAAIVRRLCRNLEALQQHRPAVYDAVFAELFSGRAAARYQPYPVNGTTLGLAVRQADGRLAQMCLKPDPRDAAADITTQIAPATSAGQAVGLLGLGDGYVLDHLAKNPPRLYMTQTLPVFVFEPQIELVLANLRIHDWAGDEGPIADPRFFWCVGGGWDVRFEQTFANEDYLPLPGALVRQGPHAPAIAERYQRAKQRITRRLDALHAKVHARYEQRSADEYAALFSDHPPRRPRVLLLTSRFTTVLQHSVRDAADAFEALSYETHTVIEPADHLATTNTALMRAIDRFDPDLLINLDHLRSEYGDAIPPTLPYVCWAQDHLANLTNAAAGTSVNAREFVLTMIGPIYRDLWQYPARQLIPIPKLTRVPKRPATWQQDGPDLLYVSNASATAEQLRARTLERAKGEPGHERFLEHAADRIINAYAQGRSLPAMGDVAAIVDQTAADLGVADLPAAHRSALTHTLHHPLNDGLYRQQALRWVADAADDMGLTLHLHGNGWDQHQRFARYAQGYVAYGQPLEQLTRRAKLCLQIVPSFCLHQRLLDGLVAGGFFLIRRHSSDTVFPELAALIDTHADPVADSLDTARASLNPDQRERFDQLIEQARALSDLGTPIDTVAWMRDAIASRMIPPDTAPLPRLEDVSFANPAELRERIEHFLPDERLRQQIAAQQRVRVEAELTYTAGMRRLMRRIAEQIATEPRLPA